MKHVIHCPKASSAAILTTELLILPDGQILVHNLTQPFAELLRELNPNCEQISSRVSSNTSNDLPPPPFFPLSSPAGAAGEASVEDKLPQSRGEEAKCFQTRIPSPQPSPRLAGRGSCIPNPPSSVTALLRVDASLNH